MPQINNFTELITRPSPWIVRWGTTIIFLFFIIFIFLTVFLRYPDNISIPVTINMIGSTIDSVNPEDTKRSAKIQMEISKKGKEYLKINQKIDLQFYDENNHLFELKQCRIEKFIKIDDQNYLTEAVWLKNSQVQEPIPSVVKGKIKLLRSNRRFIHYIIPPISSYFKNM